MRDGGFGGVLLVSDVVETWVVAAAEQEARVDGEKG